MLGYTSVLLDLIGDDGALRDAVRLRPVKQAQQCLPCLHIDLPGSRVFYEADRPLWVFGSQLFYMAFGVWWMVDWFMAYRLS